jgi:signal transduction histidine kinase/ligand-binding sensor domain-containing protein
MMLAAGSLRALDNDRSLRQALHRVWQVQQGLPRATIFSITQTADGYLWLGTQTGLVRFDGVRFLSVNDAGNGISLEGVVVRDLAETPDHALWLATEGAGLIHMRAGSATRFAPAGDIHRLLCDSSGRLWIGTSRGLASFHDDRLTTTPITAPVRGLCESPDGKVWIGGDGPNLSIWNRTTFTTTTIPALPPRAQILDMTFATDGALWIATSNGLVAYNLGVARRITDESVSCLGAGRDGTIWAAARDGFSRIRNAGRDIDTFRSGDGLSQSTVFAIREDREGSLWVGTKHGLNQFLDRRVIPYTTTEGLPSNDVGAVYGNASGTTWVGTLDAPLARFDGRAFTPLPARGARALTDDGAGGLWAGSRDGTVWVGTTTGVAALRDNRLVAAASLSVVALGEDPSGHVYAALETGGLLLRDDKGSFTPTGPEVPVSAFAWDRDGAMWLATRGRGLWRVADGKPTGFGIRDGLFDDDLYAVVSDDQDRLWLACSKGIFSVNRPDLLRGKGFTSTPFSPTEGQRTIECKPGVQPAAWRMADGRIWFVTIRGVIVVDPNNLRPKLNAPHAVLEEVLVDGRTRPTAALARVEPSHRNFEFRYTALSFVSPARMTFHYKLEGFDRDWVDAGNRREAFYTNLPAGNYRFLVRATNVDGTVGEPAAVAMTLEPHFFQRPWFWPVCAAMLLALVAAAYRARVRRIRERLHAIVDERSRIARELHDTLLQGFSGVTMEMQGLSARLPDEERGRLQEIIRDAAQCMVEARRSVAGLRGEHGGIAAAVAETAKRVAEAAAGTARLKLAVAYDGPEPPREVQYHLLRIAQEAVTNAVRHAGARTIEVGLANGDGVLRLTVSDDGRGFDPEAAGAGDGVHWGLVGMRERALQVGGGV